MNCHDCGRFLKRKINNEKQQIEWYCLNDECFFKDAVTHDIIPKKIDVDGFWEMIDSELEPDDPRLSIDTKQLRIKP